MKQAHRYTSLFAACLLSACSSSGDDAPTGQPQAQANYTSIDCAELSSTDVANSGLMGDETVECGLVAVPTDWSVENGEKIKLAVYRIPSTSAMPAADPVVYLEGGPGGAGVASVAEFTIGDSSYLRSRSDVIVIDQRGTGYSTPALYCPEVFKAAAEDGDETAAHQVCHDRFVAEGVRIADYNSAYNAKDINAVRQALGYTEWNLYGLSYGTRLALTVMRDVPDGVRSVVLDSVFPPEINGLSETPYIGYWVIEQIAINCAADADCNANIGDIKAVIEDGIARLDANPVDILTADVYLEFLASELADPELAETIFGIANGTDAEILTALQEKLAEDELGDDERPEANDVTADFYPFVAEADGMGFGVVCGEEAPYREFTAGPDISANFRESTQRIVNRTSEPFDGNLCSIYVVPPRGEIETKAVLSAIPTLVLAGTADVATPPAWSSLTDDTLENSQYAEFDGLTHGLLGSNDCVNQITLAFLDKPNAISDQTCIGSLPRVDYVTE